MLGELLALASSICFSIGPTFNTLAGRYVGAISVNRVRLVITTLLLLLMHWIVLGNPYPFAAFPQRWIWLTVSGISSLVIADTLLFAAFEHIGARLTMLINTLSPIISAVLAWIFLDEMLSGLELIGMAITISGVGWVVASSGNGLRNGREASPEILKGAVLALGAALMHAVGATAAKRGLLGDFPVLSGHMIRMSMAMLVLVGLTMLQGQVRPTLARFRDKPGAMKHVVLAAIAGPFIGMWLSLSAVQLTNVGIATTLSSLPPVLLIPVGYFIFHEKFGWSEIIGTFVTMAGVALIFLT